MTPQQQPPCLPPTSTPTPTSTTPPPPESSDPPSSPPSIALPPSTEFNYSSPGIFLSSSLQCPAFIPSPSTTLPQPTTPSTTTIQLISRDIQWSTVHINHSTNRHSNSFYQYRHYRLGGVVGLSVVALLVWFLLRKRRQSES
ncbi:hypothetical protein D9756_000027 [Leucocoprinus leucothites]|uniref:Uncharacterized protein n=1 Tax=Leucocoprinus leucothites TaxID=201217 RepID=A0A8H5GFR3_9AGAR|nr:hypothetical protein D9756_000027 [Leucoagaricus leucothites]